MLKRVLSTLLALTLTAGSLCSTLIVSAAPPEPESKSTDFITSKTDIDELLRREYIDAMKRSLKAQLDSTVLVEPDGTRRPLKK